MKKCRKCEKEFVAEKGLINFCSWKCKNGKTFSNESNEKRAESNRKFWRFLSTEERDKLISKYSNSHTEESVKKLRETYKNKLLARDFNTLGQDARRRVVIHEQAGICNRCKLSLWLDQPLTLEMDHIDGNNHNNERSNLEALCPNCHSLTPTWRGRNRPNKNGAVKVSDEELIELLKIHKNIRQALLASGLAAKGKNYAKAKKLLETIEADALTNNKNVV